MKLMQVLLEQPDPQLVDELQQVLRFTEEQQFKAAHEWLTDRWIEYRGSVQEGLGKFVNPNLTEEMKKVYDFASDSGLWKAYSWIFGTWLDWRKTLRGKEKP